MADIKSPEARSKNMSAIRSVNTRPEVKIRKALFAKGYRYRLYDKKLPGKPDIVLPKYKTVIFIHGCFWHGHEGCYLYKRPVQNREFWDQKIGANKQRDAEVTKVLLEKKWKVLIVWECSIKGRYKLPFDDVISKIIAFIHSDKAYDEIRSSE